VKYSQKQQAQVASEMDASPQAEWVTFITDYGKLRRQVKAACGE
jgi:hypothetical protein